MNALNTVQKIKAMSKMSKIDKVHIRGVMLCMSKMSKMGKEHTHTFWLITSLILNGFSIRKKVSEKLRLRAFQPYHQILCILKHVGDVGDRSSTPKGCNAIYVGDRNNLQYTQCLMVWLKSPKSQLFKNFFRIENPLSIKEVMGQNVCVCSFPIFDIFDIHSITALRCYLIYL